MNAKNCPNPVTDKSTELVIGSDPSTLLSPAPFVAHPPALMAAPPQNAAIDSINRRKVEALRRKQRADSFYNSLTDEQGDKLFNWLTTDKSIGEVHDIVIAPPPDGLGLEVSMQTLRRIRSQIRGMDVAIITEALLDTIDELEESADLTQSTRIQNTISHLLQEHAFEIARTVPGSPVMNQLITGIQKLAAIDLQRQKLQLEREKLLRQNNSGDSPRRHRTQHHQVDPNIVAPPQRPQPNTSGETIVVSSDPSQPPQLPPPNH